MISNIPVALWGEKQFYEFSDGLLFALSNCRDIVNSKNVSEGLGHGGCGIALDSDPESVEEELSKLAAKEPRSIYI